VQAKKETRRGVHHLYCIFINSTYNLRTLLAFKEGYMSEVINIPKELWHCTILVKNRVRFLECLRKGQLLEYYKVDEVKKKSMETVFKDWHQIRIGLNCILPY
jgi:hypothetical protein